jgi:hypothetical protein
VLTLFGGFLVKIAPPPTDLFSLQPNFALGLTAFACLGLLLIVGLVARDISSRTWTLIAAVLLLAFIGGAFSYVNLYHDRTFLYPESDPGAWAVIRGEEYTPEALQLFQSLAQQGLPRPTDAELLAGFGGVPEHVWTRASINVSSRTLIVYYFLVVVSISTCVFAGAEGIASKSE